MSQFLLLATVEHLLDSYGTKLAEKIKDNVYVDNVVTSVNSPEEAVKFYHDSKSMFVEASMNLREWLSSCTTVNKFISLQNR